MPNMKPVIIDTTAPSHILHYMLNPSSSSSCTIVGEILDEVSEVLNHGEDEDEELLQIPQPRLFNTNDNIYSNDNDGKIVVVSQFSTKDDSDLRHSDFAGDIISLLSSSSFSSSSSMWYENGDETKNHEQQEEAPQEHVKQQQKDITSAGIVLDGETGMIFDKNQNKRKKSYDDGDDDILSINHIVVSGDEVLIDSPCWLPVSNKKQKISLPLPPRTTTTTLTNNRTAVDGDNTATILPSNLLGIYHAEQWKLRFRELVSFKETFGHCNVPHKYESNARLSQWVRRQRYQYKLKQQGEHSTITKQRQEMLEKIGFVWDYHETSWNNRYNELREFSLKHGHSNVPINYPPNHQLSFWVKCQRRQYKLEKEGKRSSMTSDRIAKLEALNFDWNPRNLMC